MGSCDDVLFEEVPGYDGNLGVITLNRPSVLNSLNHNMIYAIYNQLRIWEPANQIKAVVIRAVEGRAFCAGGDLRLTYERAKSHDPTMTRFFKEEYQLNRYIFHYSKPYVALLDGITMGGGVGISIHGSHRVATDKLLFAMPETGIGFFPDVGGSYFLPRLPGKIGFYLGLTGARIASDDCVQVGIATHKVAREALPELIHQLAQCSFSNNAYQTVSKVIEQFKVPVKSSPLLEQQSEIDDCFNKVSMEDILCALQQSQNHPICKAAATAIYLKSPTSLKVTLKALQEGQHLDFDVCMRQEYRLVSRFLQGHDFLEGIRAVIIDKDHSPIWEPSVLEDVSVQEIEKYFAPLTEELA
ncbi:MAG: enoyl-CoA hydratase/isomerase family protein [Gammaproteobacteria bacterium]|nr:enoyl-CoA hydratase/isomerase family protein [Gammaproteobacteria bacterium]MCW5582864.1 enoyl-CoA hydratase/isomerase family protein [Gammaproteobacteria bacterium]